MYCKCTAKCTEPTCSWFRFGVQATHRKRARSTHTWRPIVQSQTRIMRTIYMRPVACTRPGRLTCPPCIPLMPVRPRSPSHMVASKPIHGFRVRRFSTKNRPAQPSNRMARSRILTTTASSTTTQGRRPTRRIQDPGQLGASGSRRRQIFHFEFHAIAYEYLCRTSSVASERQLFKPAACFIRFERVLGPSGVTYGFRS